MTITVRRTLFLLLALSPSLGQAGAHYGQKASEPGAVEVTYVDGRVLRLTLTDEEMSLLTSEGKKVRVPVAKIQSMEFAMRVSDKVRQQIETAIVNLGNDKFEKRKAAAATLRQMREKAYPALLQATKHTDAEVSRSAKDLLKELHDVVPEQNLAGREHDVVYTEDAKMVGQLETMAVQGRSATGKVEVPLTELRSLRSMAFVVLEETLFKNAVSSPVNLQNFSNRAGKIYLWKVTGQTQGQVWGTDTYSASSTLAAAAVHAGAVRVGETKLVCVKVLEPQNNIVGSKRNGVVSENWPPMRPGRRGVLRAGGVRGGAAAAYQFVRPSMMVLQEAMKNDAHFDPGNLNGYVNQVGNILTFKVTGRKQAGRGQGRGNSNVWGTDIYALESSLAVAAVHAGVVQVGETKLIRVKILGPQQNNFAGSNRNGVVSLDRNQPRRVGRGGGGAYQFVNAQ